MLSGARRAHRVLEGDWEPRRLVIVEFGSVALAKGFYASPEYRDCKELRMASGSANVILVEGLESTETPSNTGGTAGPKGYVLFDVNIHDMAQYQHDMQRVKPEIEAAGGRYLVRGAPHAVLEGGWDPHRLVIFEFPSVQHVEAFYNSDVYQTDTKALRDDCSSANIVLVEGLEDSST
ncbi:MAG: hypothetical protein Cons2KO_26030 [Congregibacter sp.]